MVIAFQEFIEEGMNFLAKLHAVVTSMEALQLGANRLSIETDALAIIRLLHSWSVGDWTLQHLLMRVGKIQARLEAKFTHSYRERNALAGKCCSEGQKFEDII